jgi:hypothetical protein
MQIVTRNCANYFSKVMKSFDNAKLVGNSNDHVLFVSPGISVKGDLAARAVFTLENTRLAFHGAPAVRGSMHHVGPERRAGCLLGDFDALFSLTRAYGVAERQKQAERLLCARIRLKLITAAAAVAIRRVMKNSTQAILLCKTHSILHLSRVDRVFEFWIIGR